MFVDGTAGSVTIDPSEEQRARRQSLGDAAATLAVIDGNGTTAHGHMVPLLTNVGGAKDAVTAAALGAQGVGLFRTEFCFLERDAEPTVEEQAAAYQGVFDAFLGKKVVLRTLDAGADKPCPSSPTPRSPIRPSASAATAPISRTPACWSASSKQLPWQRPHPPLMCGSWPR